MYKPHFTITPKITSDLEALGTIFGYFKAIEIPENYKKELITKITAETVHSSTAIEGNTLTKKQVEDLLDGKKIIAEAEDINEAINYNEVLNYIQLLKRENKLIITEALIKKINYIILKNIKSEIAGKYRKKQVIVGDYLPPEHTKIPSLMKNFVLWLNNPLPHPMSPILYAGIAHYQLVAIHPFEDGNGRTARIITTIMLMQHDYDITNFFALESFYNRDRKAYYQGLNSADKYRIDEEPDLTFWLEYYVRGMLIEATRAKDEIETQKFLNNVNKKVWLNDIQKEILKQSLNKEFMKIADYIHISKMSRKGTYNTVNKLVLQGLLNRIGNGKGTVYTITEKGVKHVK